MLLFLVLCLALLQLSQAGPTIPTSDSFISPTPQNHHTYAYVGAGTDEVARFEFTYSAASDVGQVIMIVKNSNIPPTAAERQLSFYQHFSPTASSNQDLQNSNLAKKQIVEFKQGPGAATLHVFVVNLNPSHGLSYSIAVSEQGDYSANLCAPGNSPSSSSVFCSSCANGYIGAYCNINDQQMQPDNTYSFTLFPYNDPRGYSRTLTIPGQQNKITLFIKLSDINIYNYLQFKEYGNDVAGLLNYALQGGQNYFTKANTQQTITIYSKGKDISATYLNLNPGQVTVNVWYSVQSTTNILMIVLAVLGGVLFIGLVIVAVCVVKRMRSNQRAVHPRLSIPGSAIKSGQNVLTIQQIQTYFPPVLCKNVFVPEENSSQQLMPNNSQQREKEEDTVDRDCVICLCPVGNNDMMRVTYCRHIFHAHCLIEWFKKNRNCPYCRQQYSKKGTIEKYQALLRKGGKNVLMGVDLVSQIVMQKNLKSSILVQDIKQQQNI